MLPMRLYRIAKLLIYVIIAKVRCSYAIRMSHYKAV